MGRFLGIADRAGVETPGSSIDLWGTAMGLFFAVAEVLDAADIEGVITRELFEEWGYRRAPYAGPRAIPSVEKLAAEIDNEDSGYGYETVSMAYALQQKDVSIEELVYMGRVLDRYTRLLDAAGQSY